MIASDWPSGGPSLGYSGQRVSPNDSASSDARYSFTGSREQKVIIIRGLLQGARNPSRGIYTETLAVVHVFIVCDYHKASQMRTVPSRLAETRRLPSSLNARLLTPALRHPGLPQWSLRNPRPPLGARRPCQRTAHRESGTAPGWRPGRDRGSAVRPALGGRGEKALDRLIDPRPVRSLVGSHEVRG